MKKYASLVALTALLALLCSCSAANDTPSIDPSPGQPTESAKVESEVSQSPAKQDIMDYLSGLGYEVSNTKESASRLEFMLTLPGFSDQDLSVAPENWDDIKAGVMDAEAGAKEFAADISITLYLQDDDGNNYLTVFDGKEKYCAFNSYSAGGANPPTISMEEYNAIKTGMTFQEVYDIVGGPGEVLSEVDLGMGEEYHTIMKTWVGEGSIGANANVTFQGGKVTLKAQFGLE